MLPKWLRRTTETASSKTTNPVPGAQPIQAPDTLLARERPLVDELNQLTGMSARHWSALYLPLLQSYAAFVQLLSASEAHHHAAPGGLLRHGLETTVFALRTSRAKFGSSKTAVEDTAREEHCIRYAIVAAALLHDIAKPVTDQTVELFNEQGQPTGTWNPWQGTMLDTKSIWYRSKYKAQRKYATHQAANLLVARALIPEEGLTWLSSNQDVFQDWLSAFTSPDKKTLLLEAIRKGDQYVHVVIDDWVKKMTVLCMPIETLWPNEDTRPDPMAGAIQTSPEDDPEEKPTKRTSPTPSDEPPPFEGPYTTSEQDEDPERLPASPPPPPEVAPPIRQKPSPNTKRSPKSQHDDGSELEFAKWIREGLAQGNLACNTQEAVVHGLEGGLFLVSPIIFKQFASKAMIDWKSLQRRVQRRGWHERSPDGKNVRTAIVTGERSETGLRGLLITGSEEMFGQHPPPNPHIELKAEISENSETANASRAD